MADMLLQMYYGGYVMADMYYGRYIMADILCPTKTCIARQIDSGRSSRLLRPKLFVATHHTAYLHQQESRAQRQTVLAASQRR